MIRPERLSWFRSRIDDVAAKAFLQSPIGDGFIFQKQLGIFRVKRGGSQGRDDNKQLSHDDRVMRAKCIPVETHGNNRARLLFDVVARTE